MKTASCFIAICTMILLCTKVSESLLLNDYIINEAIGFIIYQNKIAQATQAKKEWKKIKKWPAKHQFKHQYKNNVKQTMSKLSKTLRIG